MTNPILGIQTVRRGQITDHCLRTRYRAVHRNVYVANDVELTAELRARAAWLFAGPNAVLAGMSAAAVHGTKWLDPNSPAEVVRANRHGPAGIIVRSYALDADEVCERQGMRVTTAARTAFDIGRSLPLPRAVPILDALLNATRLEVADVLSLADRRRGARGVRAWRALAELVDGGAESPRESRVRLLLTAAGLPRPETQIEFRDSRGDVVIRVDMGWRQWKVAVEYDGVQHWSDGRQRSWDIERIAMLEALGWSVIRVSAEMLRRPDVILERVRAKLRDAGCPV
ncbi:DUF559 domain-containing protein [Mycobacterium hodleri]|uniref:DUF559 domain-containing protein n=1 Tax=Mycolicibacterium hodleri TaxID=49897 RepID=UPI0021F3699A|nr:DUF559 domain-containing protein [Mycolicibacterium hodleri]MCV7132294.1 DUF559 domain-containing protein [Mycolicibacterium hodleri]